MVGGVDRADQQAIMIRADRALPDVLLTGQPQAVVGVGGHQCRDMAVRGIPAVAVVVLVTQVTQVPPAIPAQQVTHQPLTAFLSQWGVSQ